jgi:hypothetical protein
MRGYGSEAYLLHHLVVLRPASLAAGHGHRLRHGHPSGEAPARLQLRDALRRASPAAAAPPPPAALRAVHDPAVSLSRTVSYRQCGLPLSALGPAYETKHQHA